MAWIKWYLWNRKCVCYPQILWHNIIITWSVARMKTMTLRRSIPDFVDAQSGGERRCSQIRLGRRILRQRGVQLILAYSWARPAILVASKDRWGGGCFFYFICFFTYIPVPLSSLSFSFISSTISSISFLPFSGRRHKMTHKSWRVVKPKHNQSISDTKENRWTKSVCGCQRNNYQSRLYWKRFMVCVPE